jgi:hypothetical protein
MARLDIQRDAETAKRKGSAKKTIFGVIWLGICFAAAYFFVGWLFDSGNLSPSFFWNQLFIPRQVSAQGIQILAAFLFVIGMNFFVLLGFAFSSSSGRTRPGTPSMMTRNPDPSEGKYNYK